MMWLPRRPLSRPFEIVVDLKVPSVPRRLGLPDGGVRPHLQLAIAAAERLQDAAGAPRDAAAVIHRSGRASSWTRAASTTALMRGRLRGRRLALLDGTRDRGGLSDVEMDALVARAAVAATAFRSHGFATRACDRVKLEVRMNRDARAREAKDDDLPLARVEANAAAEARDARVLKLAGKIRRLRDSEIARAVQAAGDRTSEPSPDAVVGLALATTRPRDVVASRRSCVVAKK